MDKASSVQAGMEGVPVLLRSQSDSTEMSKLPVIDIDYSNMAVGISGAKLSNDDDVPLMNMPEPRVAGGSVHCSRAMDHMSDSHREDCSGVDEILPGFKPKKITEPSVAGRSGHCSIAEDIDKKLATGRQLPPAETDDEAAPVVYLLSLGLHNKERPQKRAISQPVYEQNASYGISPETLKFTENVIQRINGGTANEHGVSCTFNRQYFSDVRNLTRVLGTETSGTFGDVVKVRDSQTKRILIQKWVKKNAQGQFKVEKNELQVPLQFDVDNIAKFFGLYWKGDTLLFIMEDAGISLRELITDKKFCGMLLERDTIEKIMLDVYRAISHLASHNITHSDIKPENVCYNMKTEVAKLIDFGSCKTPQDSVNYHGITPEYLDPVANKYLCQVYVTMMPNPTHRLDEKDDVFGAGLVGLFLLKKVHPMIHFFTGRDMAKNNAERRNIMEKIINLTEKQMSQLLDVPMSGVMKVLLQGVLALDREKRWTAKGAVSFLQGKLCSDVSPHKLPRQEPQPCSSRAEDQSKLVKVRKKNLHKVVASNIQTCESAASTQTGGILLPKKFFFQQKMISPLDQLNPQPQYLQVGQGCLSAQHMQRCADVQQQRCADMQQQRCADVQQQRCANMQQQRCADMQQQQRDLQKVPVSAGSSQRMWLPNPRAGQPMSDNLGPVQEDQPATGPILGLSGNPYQFAGSPNIPHFEKLFQTSEEPCWPKLKGRKSHGSQDEK